jgi:hypothetical protein
MFRSKLSILAIAITLPCVALAGYVRNNAENKQLPRNGWAVGFHSYRAEGFDSIPVRVISVTSKGNQGLTNVELRNRSSKPVTAVKIGWYVSTEDGPGTVLTKGESPLLSLPATLQADERLQLKVPPVSLAKILKPVVKGNTLRGDFSVQVAVIEIVYEDGSTWKFSEPNNVARVQLNNAHALPPGCAGQTCKWKAEIQAYQCEASSGELCTNSGDSCTSSACGSGEIGGEGGPNNF